MGLGEKAEINGDEAARGEDCEEEEGYDYFAAAHWLSVLRGGDDAGKCVRVAVVGVEMLLRENGWLSWKKGANVGNFLRVGVW